jgi:hypothetical protein
MNYTKLNISGEDYGLKFGMHSARYLSSKLDNGYCFHGDEITEIGISHVIYSGYLNNCAVKDVKPELTFEHVVDFVESSIGDASKVDALTSVIKVWSESQIIKGAEEAKKKTLKKSKS